MAATVSSLSSSSTSCHLFHYLLRPSPLPPPSSSLLSLKPLFTAAAAASTTTATLAAARLQSALHSTFFSASLSSLATRTRRFSALPRSSLTSPLASSPVSLLHSQSASEPQHEFFGDDEEVEDEEEDDDTGSEDGELQVEKPEFEGFVNESPQLIKVKPPSLTVKEKKELASYAHSLGKKLKTQQVGKSGVTVSVVSSFIETLEANELLKLKIHGNCPGELTDVVKQLGEATGSVVVGQIGRTVILYRPSLSKLKAEEKRKQGEKKKQARGGFVSKELKVKPTLEKKGQIMRPSGRGRRGSSRL